MQEPVFRDSYAEARKQSLTVAIGQLQQASRAAVETLCNVMQSSETPPGQKVSAARCVLDYAFKGAEMIDLEARLAELEARIEQQDQDNTRQDSARGGLSHG